MLVARSGYTKGRVSQFLDKRQAFGERAARALEERLGLPKNYFEGGSTATPVTLSEQQLVDSLRPSWRELILAYEELLPEDRDVMVQPILRRAEDMRRHFESALARQGVQHQALTSTGHQLPLAPQTTGPERRQVILGRSPERRTPLQVIDAPSKTRKTQK